LASGEYWRAQLRHQYIPKNGLTIRIKCITTLIHLVPVVQIHISTNDGVPIYLQVVNQVKYLVASGRLAPGEELPPIRVLAEQLLVNPNTVARAYLELERDGIVTKRHGAGTYVSDGGSPLARKERMKILGERADGLIAEAHHLNVDLDELIDLLKQRRKHFKGPL
jgi:GntR family transcriptional regulator